MTHPDRTNWTIIGSGWETYLIALVRLGRMAWSSLYDKGGDWAISCQDDASRAEIEDALDWLLTSEQWRGGDGKPCLEIVYGGELTMRRDDLLDEDGIEWSGSD